MQQESDVTNLLGLLCIKYSYSYGGGLLVMLLLNLPQLSLLFIKRLSEIGTKGTNLRETDLMSNSIYIMLLHYGI